MEILRIAELLEPYLGPLQLSETQLQEISTYINILLKWNARMDLTAIRDPEQIVARHFGESFFAARHLLTPTAGEDVFDVGSGAGFPGIPLKIYAPGIALTLIEAQNKKAVFLREVVRAAAYQNVQVIGTRAEVLEEKGQLVTMRAVEKFETILPVAANLVVPGGRLGLLIGERQLNVAQRLVLGTWECTALIPNSNSRVVATWVKSG